MNSFSSSSLRLWQLISPTLPIGAYSYSQGLEYAIEAGWVYDEQTSSEWILGQIKNTLSHLDVPVCSRLYDAWQKQDMDQVNYWNRLIVSLRESSELRMEDCNLGNALIKVLQGLDVEMPQLESEDIAFVCVYSFACRHWSINKEEAMHGLLWSWCENQVAAAIKLVPLGQTSGQRIMSQSINVIKQAIVTAVLCEDEDIGILAP